jgi:hypothetical protein
MTKTDAGLPEQGAQTSSRARDLIPAEREYQPRSDIRTGAANHEMSPGLAEGESDSHWADILAAASNPDFQRAEFVRLILGEMSSACHELSLATRHSSLQFKVKPLTAEIRALRTLAETAHDLPELATQDDVLNIDGPKFDYVMGTVIRAFKESMIQADCGVLVRQTVLRFFSNNWAKTESEIRRNLEKAHTLVGSGETLAWSQGEGDSSRNKTPHQAPVPNGQT